MITGKVWVLVLATCQGGGRDSRLSWLNECEGKPVMGEIRSSGCIGTPLRPKTKQPWRTK